MSQTFHKRSLVSPARHSIAAVAAAAVAAAATAATAAVFSCRALMAMCWGCVRGGSNEMLVIDYRCIETMTQ